MKKIMLSLGISTLLVFLTGCGLAESFYTHLAVSNEVGEVEESTKEEASQEVKQETVAVLKEAMIEDGFSAITEDIIHLESSVSGLDKATDDRSDISAIVKELETLTFADSGETASNTKLEPEFSLKLYRQKTAKFSSEKYRFVGELIFYKEIDYVTIKLPRTADEAGTYQFNVALTSDVEKLAEKVRALE